MTKPTISKEAAELIKKTIEDVFGVRQQFCPNQALFEAIKRENDIKLSPVFDFLDSITEQERSCETCEVPNHLHKIGNWYVCELCKDREKLERWQPKEEVKIKKDCIHCRTDFYEDYAPSCFVDGKHHLASFDCSKCVSYQKPTPPLPEKIDDCMIDNVTIKHMLENQNALIDYIEQLEQRVRELEI